ncbi:LamB/YcsF family protein [Salinisphaera sp. USBA-960]|nr:LamB/YcsF family protein [Salifodinibacter halophilus]NNC25363.1 LamB/YcsF family protein [Salifodinibacter halophilus]
MPTIDMNSDVGESFGRWRLGDDAAIFESVSSANVACGFHAGDPSTLAETCRAAVAANVTIGAHVAYRDLAGFGRRFIDYAPDELADDILYQIGALGSFAKAAGDRVRYVKPHGALYNAIVRNEDHARAVVDAVTTYDASLPILALPGSAVLDIADQRGVRGVIEAFADRSYNPDGTLVSRREPDAIIHDDDTIVTNMIRLAEEQCIIARDGSKMTIAAESICVHGDNPSAVATATAVHTALKNAGIQIAQFT